MQNIFLTSSGERNCRNLRVQAFILKVKKLRSTKGKPEVTSWVGARIRLEMSHLSPNTSTFLPHHKAASSESHLSVSDKNWRYRNIPRMCSRREVWRSVPHNYLSSKEMYEPLKYPSPEKRRGKLWWLCRLEYYTAVKMNALGQWYQHEYVSDICCLNFKK